MLNITLCSVVITVNHQHEEWCEMAKTMSKVAAPPDVILNTVSAKDQIYGEVSMSFAVKWEDDVPSTMYYFLKDKGWTHLHLKDVAKCRLVFNHCRKSLKIGVGWKQFSETLSLTAGMEIVFKFIDPTVNRVLFWPCL
ncbi:hypothetical protein HKD37_14G039688 [Glycine soja]